MKPSIVPYLLISLYPAGIICFPCYIPQYFIYLFCHCALEFSFEFIKQLNKRWPCDMTLMFRNLFNIFPTNSLILSNFYSLYSLSSFTKAPNYYNLIMALTCGGIPVAIIMCSDRCVVTIFLNYDSKAGHVKIGI